MKIDNESQREKEKLHSMMHFSQRFLDTERVPDLHEITEFMRTLTGAVCAVFNQYEENGMGFTTEAIAVKTQYLLKTAEILGFNPIGKKWPHDTDRQAKIQEKMVTYFENLQALTAKSLPVNLTRLVEKTFDIGQVAIVKTIKKEKAIGDFTLIMSKGVPMESQELAILYATQVGMHLDRVQYEQNLKASEEKHRRLFETMSPGVVYQDFDGAIISANPAAERLIGITLEQMQGKTSIDPRWKMIREDGSSVPGPEHPSMMALRTGKRAGPVTRGVFIPEMNNYVWLSITAIPLFREGEDKPFQVYAIFDDITERKKAEEKLIASKEQLETLSNNIPNGMVYQMTVDPPGNRRFTYVSAGVEQLQGVTQAEVLKNSKVLYDQILEEDKQRFIEAEEQAFSTLKPFLCEARIRKPDGEVRWIQFQSALTKKQDDSILENGIAIDITDRKIAEEKLHAAASEAEKANQAKSRYLAHMNHEIRTPLNGFIGFLQLMATTNMDELQQEYMHYMEQSAVHILSIINNVLDMAKIEAGEMQLTNRIFNPAEEIHTALAPLHSLARQNNTQLQVTMNKNLPQLVKGDPDRLRQIALNIGGNAVKFTHEGQVHISIQCLETNQKHHTLQMLVEDTGTGMTKETIDRMFLPFYQADDGSTPQSKGTGLGMTITRELVELMGGQIKVESTPGKGTRMEIHLKLSKVTAGYKR